MSETISKQCPTCGKPFSPRYAKQRTCSLRCRFRPLKERFLAKIQKTDGCWLWMGAKMVSGYGWIQNNNTRIYAHRLSWEIHNGPIPNGLFVLHDCPGGDNPSCVNPAHLKLGNHIENQADKVAKGRQARGSHHNFAKLDEASIEKIRGLRENGMLQREIAERFGVCPQTISSIVRRETWRHV